MELLGEARYAAKIARGAHLAPPAEGGRLRRFVWGFALPFGIVRAALREPMTRSVWLRWSAVQVAILLAVGIRIGMATSHAFDGLKHLSASEVVAFVSATYAALCILEWVLIAVARDYHDVLSHLAARATGVIAEPVTGPPRVRIDFGWLWLKAKRRLRGAWLFVTALPLLAWVLLIPIIGDGLYVALTSAWGAYWLAVFAVGGSAFAWDTPTPAPPWYVRALARVGRVPVLGIPPRLYGRFLAWGTRSVAPVCVAFERDPWSAAGLATARALSSAPGVYIFMRPAFSVAATHALFVPLLLRRQTDIVPQEASPAPVQETSPPPR